MIDKESVLVFIPPAPIARCQKAAELRLPMSADRLELTGIKIRVLRDEG